MFRQNKKRKVKALLVSVLFGGQACLAAENCIRPTELEADKIRFVETQLKVAALQCRTHTDVEFSNLYSSFLRENRPFLVKSTKSLVKYLNRSGAGPVEQHVSNVAKRVSYESTQVSQFCNRAKLAAQFSMKSSHPAMLLNMLPVRYERPAEQCRR